MRRELGTDVDMVRGRYGEYRVMVDGDTVVDGGALVVLGMMPPMRKTIATVREALSRPEPQHE